MNRNLLIAIAVLIIIIAGGGLFVLNQQGSDNTIMKKDESVMTEEGQSDAMMEESTSYIPYSSEAYGKNSDKRRVLYFYANWCPTCRPLDKEISEKVSQIPDDVVIIRVNYNDSDTDQEEKDLARKYAITYQHTFVQVDENGNELKKWSGGAFNDILSNIQ